VQPTSPSGGAVPPNTLSGAAEQPTTRSGAAEQPNSRSGAAVQATTDEVRGQLDRLLASDVFAGAARLSRFLRHVVERTLAGEGDRLKEYAIGIDVFDRDESYDPRLDSIVRVEATRLRAKLTEYYSGAGAADPVVIRMRPGGYAPEFERRPATSSAPLDGAGASLSAPRRPARLRLALGLLVAAILLLGIAAWRNGMGPWDQRPARTVTIVVLPFAHYSTSRADELLAARLTDGVTSELARLGELGVVSHTSALQFTGARRPLREIAQTLGADVVMEARVSTEGGRVRIQARLVDGVRDRKLWVEDFVGTVSDLDALQRRIATAATAAARSPRRR
jgi:TolB-like protein